MNFLLYITVLSICIGLWLFGWAARIVLRQRFYGTLDVRRLPIRAALPLNVRRQKSFDIILLNNSFQ